MIPVEKRIPFAKRLLEVTHDCRHDMHEPDEQGIKCRVIGDHLDNAFGESVAERPLVEGFQEFVVVIERRDPPYRVERLNLATLIAFARIGAAAQPDLTQ